ncbi:hypothetical protein WICPIJ_009373 [Wickerhamomyces pijperi]|uniref:Uncharacterized protein n=1 Tax=Wickerhamomyces pijperi TaxID=599730 RepID=A0A9P8PMV2_WICPI|nr:hypothetical protein WICPIJ_009373 [Wickerhamomyces pijperi]
MTWQQSLEQINWPFLQGFLHDCVVGVPKHLCDDTPGIVPRQPFQIDEDSLQFDNGNGWMGVVQLDGYLIWELNPCLHGVGVITRVELGEIELSGGLSRPKSQVVDVLGVITRNREVVSSGNDSFAANPVGFLDTFGIGGMFDIPVEINWDLNLLSSNFPWVFKFQPIIWHFHLITFNDFLLENTVLIT